MAVVFAAACITTTTRYFVRTEGDPRLSTAAMKDEADAQLRLQCPRLLNGSQSATGEARIVAEIDRTGAVTKARVARTSGDEMIDAVFGSLVARLQFDPPTNMRGDTGAHPIYVGYSCSPTVAVTTLNITGDPTPPLPPRTIPPA